MDTALQLLSRTIVRDVLGLSDKWTNGFTQFQYEVGWLRGRNKIGERTRGPIGGFSHPDAETSYPSLPENARRFIPVMAALKLWWWCGLGEEGLKELRALGSVDLTTVDDRAAFSARLEPFKKRHQGAWVAARGLILAAGLPLDDHFTAAEHNTLRALGIYARIAQSQQPASGGGVELPEDHGKIVVALGKCPTLVDLNDAQMIADGFLLQQLVDDEFVELVEAARRVTCAA